MSESNNTEQSPGQTIQQLTSQRIALEAQIARQEIPILEGILAQLNSSEVQALVGNLTDLAEKLSPGHAKHITNNILTVLNVSSTTLTDQLRTAQLKVKEASDGNA